MCHKKTYLGLMLDPLMNTLSMVVTQMLQFTYQSKDGVNYQNFYWIYSRVCYSHFLAALNKRLISPDLFCYEWMNVYFHLLSIRKGDTNGVHWIIWVCFSCTGEFFTQWPMIFGGR